MSSINLHAREISIKVVYYGPGLGGKTTSLQYIHRFLRPELRGQLVSLATGIDRTLFFDFLPVKLPKVKDYNIRMSLYTVPGQVHYDATRKLVLQGCDGVVFVADSQPARREANLESLANLAENLRGHGMEAENVPTVLQYNKRDIKEVMPVEQMDRELNPRGLERFETCAVSGAGIFDAMRAITKLVLADLKRKGIYLEARARKAADVAWAPPVLSPTIEKELVRTLEASAEAESGRASAAEPPAPAGGLGFSELWQPGAGREQMRKLEDDIARGHLRSAIAGAEGLLRDCLGQTEGQGTVAELLLVIGASGAHYARFREALAKPDPTRQDALFCLFFLTDVELKLRAAGVRVEA